MRAILLLFVLAYSWIVSGQIIPGYEEYCYKKSDTISLRILVRKPQLAKSDSCSPAIVFFYGGGWNSANIEQFKPQADYFTSRGMVAVLAEYRVRNRHQSTPFDAVSDSKSVIRFIRKHSEMLGINPNKLVAAGGSAGGHLAAATATIEGLNDLRDDLRISPKPNVLILFNPVIDNGPTGYGYERVKEKYLEISPIHNIRKEMPPAIILSGTKDHLVPVETLQLFKTKMEEAGSRCDLVLYENQKHGFFNFSATGKNKNEYYKKTIAEADKFLVSLGFLQ